MMSYTNDSLYFTQNDNNLTQIFIRNPKTNKLITLNVNLNLSTTFLYTLKWWKNIASNNGIIINLIIVNEIAI